MLDMAYVVECSIILFARTNMCCDCMPVYDLGVAHSLCRWMHMLIQVHLSYKTVLLRSACIWPFYVLIPL